MSGGLEPVGSGAYLQVGDPRRPLVWLAVRRTFLLALVFSLSTGPVKQLGLYHHAPWTNDPYDTVVSFSMVFVPFVSVLGLARVWLCRTTEALPLERVRDVLHACVVVIVCVLATSGTEWAAVAAGANRRHWNAATWLQLALLAVVTLAAVPAVLDLRRARLPRDLGGTSRGVDWLADVPVLARRLSRWLGPLSEPWLEVVDWGERHVVPPVRRHPLWTAGLACAAFGAALGGNQAIQERYDVASTVLVVVLIACGTFLFLVTAGPFLGLVRAPVRLLGARRRAVDALATTIVVGLVAFAFRYHLWWLVDTTNERAGTRQLVLLLLSVGIPSFVVALAAETVLGLHSDDDDREGGTPPRGLSPGAPPR